MLITKEQIVNATDCSENALTQQFLSLMMTFDTYSINTKQRAAAFLANVLHETGGLRHFEENLNYSAKGLLATWPHRFSQKLAEDCARQPEKIANIVYQNRYGNDEPGDGWKYRGRGAFQTTFKANYQQLSDNMNVDFVTSPDLLETSPYAMLSAGYYWNDNHLNGLADLEEIEEIRKRINGGTIGLPQVEEIYKSLMTEMNK